MSGYSAMSCGQRLGDLGRADDDHVDALLGEIADGGRGVGGLDVVDDDRLIEPVLLGRGLGGVDDGLVVRAVVGRTGGSDAEHDLAVAVRVERLAGAGRLGALGVLGRRCRLGRAGGRLGSAAAVVSVASADVSAVGGIRARCRVGARIVVVAARGAIKDQRGQARRAGRLRSLPHGAGSPLVYGRTDGQTIDV